VLFIATMGLAAALAYQAARAAVSHRLAAEASLEHHATIAAWRFSRDARIWVGYGMVEASSALDRETARRAPLPGPELLHRVLGEKECDCMSAGFSRTVFRVVVDETPTVDWIGEPLSERAKDALTEIGVALALDSAARQWPRIWRILPPGVPRLTRGTDIALLWTVGDRERGVRAVYGMVVEPAQIERPLRGALGDVQFFPPSLVPTAVSDSLVRIEVAGPNGLPIFEVGPDSHAFVGTDTLGRDYGDLTVTARIDPAAAQFLIAGGIPASRAPMIAGLLALALGVGGAALVLLRREYRLARLREDFVSGVSHELRTPLTQIRVLSELLLSHGFHSEAEKTRATGAIHRESMRLSNLVDNVLEFARLRRPAAPTVTEPIALADVAHEVAESFGPLLDAQENRIDLAIADDVEVPGDRAAISRILRNLVENAVKYGPSGQTIRVTVARIDPPGGARVTVDDQGPGIPAGERTRIWQPYYRLDRDRNASLGGSGLGLSVVAELTRLLGARVSVTDAPGGGARFSIEFPEATVRRQEGS
jgi:signal transduction histidine kinase